MYTIECITGRNYINCVRNEFWSFPLYKYTLIKKGKEFHGDFVLLPEIDLSIKENNKHSISIYQLNFIDDTITVYSGSITLIAVLKITKDTEIAYSFKGIGLLLSKKYKLIEEIK